MESQPLSIPFDLVEVEASVEEKEADPFEGGFPPGARSGEPICGLARRRPSRLHVHNRSFGNSNVRITELEQRMDGWEQRGAEPSPSVRHCGNVALFVMD